MRMLKTQEEIIGKWQTNYNRPLVSICCITYNHEAYIEDTIRGFLIQETDFPFEILIHDDASSDRTADIIREYETQYPKLIRPIYQSVNQFSQGKRINPNFNFPRAKGDFLALCEGDDYWVSPQKLTQQVSALSNNPSCHLSFHPVDVLSENKSTKLFSDGYGYYGASEHVMAGTEIIIKAGPGMAMCSIMVRKSTFDRLRELNPDFFFTKVTHFNIQCVALLQGEAVYTPEKMAVYRYGHTGSWSERCAKDSMYRIEQNRKFIDALDELEQIFPQRHSQAMLEARRKKLRQSYKLIGVPYRKKISLFLEKSNMSIIDFYQLFSGLLPSFLASLKKAIGFKNVK